MLGQKEKLGNSDYLVGVALLLVQDCYAHIGRAIVACSHVVGVLVTLSHAKCRKLAGRHFIRSPATRKGQKLRVFSWELSFTDIWRGRCPRCRSYPFTPACRLVCKMLGGARLFASLVAYFYHLYL